MADINITAVAPKDRNARTLIVQAGEAIALGDVLYISGTTTSGEQTVSKADCTDVAKAAAVYLASQAAALDGFLIVYEVGDVVLTSTPTLPTAQNLLLSNTAGKMFLPADFAALGAGFYNTMVGRAKSTTDLELIFSASGIVSV